MTSKRVKVFSRIQIYHIISRIQSYNLKDIIKYNQKNSTSKNRLKVEEYLAVDRKEIY